MISNSELDMIGVRAGTDKSSLLHGYLDYYADILPQPTFVETLVEIGLQRKSGKWANSILPSIRMWEEYYPEATIYGFDKQHISSHGDRFVVYQGDQGRIYDHIRFYDLINGTIDVLIDDGSHRPSHQLLSFLFYWSKMSKGGVYIIEDCNAVVQLEYSEKHRIHSLIEPYLDSKTHFWIPSITAGQKSSLAIIKT